MTKYILTFVCILSTTFGFGCTTKCLIKSDPPGAHVSVNNQYVGDTPCVAEWKESDGLFERYVTLQVSKSGYITETRKVHRDIEALYFVLQPATADDTRVLTPTQQQEQQMQQQMSGPTIVITGGQTATGQQAVEIKEYGTVSFESIPSGAEVYEGPYFLGNTPVSKLKFQSGPHNITISIPGYEPWVRQLMVIANSDVNITAELEKSE